MPTTNRHITTSEAVSLREYIEAKLAAMETAHRLADELQQHRIEALNGARQLLQDQNAKFITRVEVDLCTGAIKEDIRSLRESRAELQGKASATSVYIGYGIALVGLILSILGLVTR